jgi:hypothetical protein
MLEHHKDCPYFDNRKGYGLCTAFINGYCGDHDCMFKKVKKDKEKRERMNLV